MAYQFTAASSQRLSADAPATPSPMTVACWARPTNTSQAGIIQLITAANSVDRIQLVMLTGGAIRINTSSNTSAQADTTQTLSVNTWGHIAAVIESQSSRTPYLNGVAGATNTTTIANHATFNLMVIGSRWLSGSLGNYFGGQLTEVGIWNVALTQPEIASLAKGMTCDKVRPQSLVFYAPLVRNLQDVRGGLTITNNNAATVATHPRVYA
jgi:hypothetical protein